MSSASSASASAARLIAVEGRVAVSGGMLPSASRSISWSSESLPTSGTFGCGSGQGGGGLAAGGASPLPAHAAEAIDSGGLSDAGQTSELLAAVEHEVSRADAGAGASRLLCATADEAEGGCVGVEALLESTSTGSDAAAFGELAVAARSGDGVAGAGTSFAIGSDRMKKLSKRGSLG